MIGWVVGFVAGVVLGGVARAWRLRRRRRARPSLPGGITLEGATNGALPGRGVRASLLDSVRDPANPSEATETTERELADDLRGYLGDLAAQHGADDVMFWIQRDDVTGFLPVAWNHQGAPPRGPWGTPQQRALVSWASAEGVVSFDSGEGALALASARVSLDAVATLGAESTARGAIVMHAPRGIRSSRGDLKLWLPRHAVRLSQFVEMQLTRNESARQNRRMRALVRASQDLSAVTTRAELERRIADDVVEASGATFAALVEWHSDARSGTVRCVTQLYPAPQPHLDDEVVADSMVGGVCIGGVPQQYHNTGTVAGSGELFGPSARFPDCGALAIEPLRRGRKVIGAIVIGASDPGAMRPGDLRTTVLFAQLAGSALEASWEIEQVKSTAHRDQLTGLWNRRHFDGELVRALDQTDRFGGACALVLVDVDHFKTVNDTHGHQAGDRVLQAIAKVMGEQVRTTDSCARIGGEEFCAILQQTDAAGALELAERLRAKIAALTVRWRDRDISVTSSFGVATYEAGGGQVKRGQLFDATDRALYRAKGEGRNCVRIA